MFKKGLAYNKSFDPVIWGKVSMGGRKKVNNFEPWGIAAILLLLRHTLARLAILLKN